MEYPSFEFSRFSKTKKFFLLFLSQVTCEMSTSSECPYWRRGYCVADKGCKRAHDPSQGGQLQDSYLTQMKENRDPQPISVPYQYSASAMASAIYGGAQPVMYGYGYYGQAVVLPIGQPSCVAPKNYKTVPCRHYMRGHCMRGDTCGFRHSEDDGLQFLLPVTSAYGQTVASEHPARPFRVLTCRRWLQGTCALGDRCTYRHDLLSRSMTDSPHSGVKRFLSPDRSANETADTCASKDDLDHVKVQKTI